MHSSLNSFHRIVTALALLSLLHCAYSAAQHRFYLRLTDQPFVRLPFDILVQTLVSLVAAIYGASHVAGDFQPIRAEVHSRKKTWEEVGSCPSFYTFDHRSKSLSPSFVALTQRGGRRACALHVGSLSVCSVTGTHSSSSSSFSSSFFSTSPDFSRLPGARQPRSTATPPKFRPLEISSANASDAFKHCIELVRKHDFDNYISALLMPSSKQPAIFALLALNVELALIRDKVSGDQAGTAGIYRLQFWRDAINAIYAQSDSVTPVPRQPIAVALCSFVPRASRQLLDNLVVARQQSLGDRPFSSVQALESYGEQTTGSLLSLEASVLSLEAASSDAVSRVASLLGRSYGAINLLRATLPLLRRGIVLLPSDLLLLHGLSADAVYKGKNPDGMRHLARDLCEVSSLHLKEARALRNRLSVHERLAFLATAATTDHLLSRLRATNFDLFDARLQRSQSLLAWRLWWRKLRRVF